MIGKCNYVKDPETELIVCSECADMVLDCATLFNLQLSSVRLQALNKVQSHVLRDKVINVTDIPKYGSTWLHTNGKTYVVLMVSNLDISDDKREEYPITVLYTADFQKMYSKPLAAFLKNRTFVSHYKEV